jgi:hypothetical protein
MAAFASERNRRHSIGEDRDETIETRGYRKIRQGSRETAEIF